MKLSLLNQQCDNCVVRFLRKQYRNAPCSVWVTLIGIIDRFCNAGICWLGVFAALLVIVSPASHAQQQVDYNKVFPVSPTAASLGQYGAVPVSFYTGTPNISIPLGSLKGKELELPISLSYMARGVKVEDNGSWVGVNWSLNAGGVITRAVRGIKDGDKPLVSFPLPTPYADLKDVFLNLQQGHTDPEPDVYYFNFNGHSGSFVFDNDGIAVFEQHNDLKVITDPTHSYFTIVTEDGTRYIFSDTWETTDGIPTAINLSQIVSPTGTEQITFQYVSERFSYYGTKRFTRWIRPNGNSFMQHAISQSGALYPLNTIDARRLSSITTNFNQNVEFVPSATKRPDFADLPSDPGPRMLDRVRFYDRFNANSRNFQLRYEVIETSVPYIQQDQVVDPTASSVAYLNRRIYLKSVQESSVDFAKVSPPHEFFYFGRTEDNRDKLPNRVSSAQDHWGYYNGYDNNLSLWPGYNGPYGAFDSDFALPVCVDIQNVSKFSFVVSGANREVRFPYNSFGTLASIKYPTGGRTDFEFETQRYVYEAAKDEFVTRPQPVTFAVSTYAGSQTLEDTETIETSLNATFEFEMNNLSCWNPNDHLPVGCGSAGSEVNYDKYQGSSVSISNSSGVEVLAVKWVPGDHGFWLYRNGQIDTSVGMLQPDANGMLSRSFQVFLPINGTYTLKAVRDPDADGDVLGWFHYEKQVTIDISDPAQARSIGGLRIKRIESFNSDNVSIGKKTYQYGTGVTFADLRNAYMYIPFNTPRIVPYCSNQDYEEPNTQGNGGALGGDYYPFIEIGTGPRVELGYSQGSTVGYSTVTETQPGNGATVYDYTTAIDYPDEEIGSISLFFYQDTYWDPTSGQWVNTSTIQKHSFPKRVTWPYQKQDNFDWRRGILKQVSYLDEAGHKLLDRKMTPVLRNKKTIGGLRFQTILPDRLWQFGAYYYSSGTMNVETIVETQYNNFEELTKTIHNFYESTHHNFLTKTTESTSEGTIKSTEFRYPDDYEGITDANHVITQLKGANLHIVGTPLETRTYRGGVLIDANILNYKSFVKNGGGSFVAPLNTYTLRKGLTPATSWSADPTAPDPIYFTKELELTYDESGALASATPRSQVVISTIWENESASPIAKVINATPKEIFYSSFESDGTLASGSNMAKTGLRYLNQGTFNFSTEGSFAPTNPSELKMSYWYWANGQWNFSGLLNFQNLISSGGTRLDEIRVHPADAQMISWTYENGVRVSSQTDANNTVTFFEYDDMSRLKLIRDHQGNILKSHIYHYKGEN